jgi:hypothetical protein
VRVLHGGLYRWVNNGYEIFKKHGQGRVKADKVLKQHVIAGLVLRAEKRV